MNALLDTHVWLWMLTAPEKLNDDVRELVSDGRNTLFLSAASSWEISIKHGLGRLDLPQPPATFVPLRLEQSSVSSLFITHMHALHAGELPPHHRDPFDRILVAQARVEGVPLLTADKQLEAYDVEIIWAA